MRFTMPSVSGWDSFADRYFATGPCVLRQPYILADPIAGFQAMVSACDAFRAGEDVPLKFHVNGMRLVEGIHARLPRQEDGSLEGYRDRMDELTAAGEYGLYCSSLQEYDGPLYERARRLLANITARCDLPVGFVELELFAGKYTATAGGIHRENCTNFHQVIDGSKSILAWPRDAWSGSQVALRQQQEPADGNEETFLDEVCAVDWASGATELAGRAGDILYWPDRFWHVGVSPEISLSINVAVYPAGRGDHSTRSAFERCLISAGAGTPADRAALGSAHVRDSTWQRLATARRIVASADFEAEIAAAEIRRVTGSGFRAMPPRPPAAQSIDGQIRLIERDALAWMTVPGYVVYGGRGYSEITTHCDAVVRLLEMLSAGESAGPGQASVRGGDPAADACATLVLNLQSMGIAVRSETVR